MYLVCPAGSPPALKAAIDHGADAVYVGFRDRTNARAFPGLNFSDRDLESGIAYAHARGRKVYVALNTYPTPSGLAEWQAAVDRAAALGADAVICADMGVLDYAARRHPGLPRHLSVQGSATTHAALRYYRDRFGIARAVLPRVLSVQQVERLCEQEVVPIEVFAFGSLCIMVEGRCQLSSYVTGASPNRHGVCSPAKFVEWNERPDGMTTRLGGFLIDRFGAGERTGYPTVCKGRYDVGGGRYYAIEEPASLDTLELLPEFVRIGVAAIKIEGRQRSPAYVADVTRTWREAIDACVAAPERFAVQPRWRATLGPLCEGQAQTLGAYSRPWR